MRFSAPVNTSLGQVKQPRTRGKIEQFSGEVERRISQRGSVDKLVHGRTVKKFTRVSIAMNREMSSGTDYLLGRMLSSV
jgi:hypothetical protein